MTKNFLIDLTGKQYFYWTVIDRAPSSKQGKTMWNCICKCGITKVVRASHLTSHASRSCGCYRVEWATKNKRTHGMSYTAEHKAWDDMKQRCYNKNSTRFEDWGGRGITVCDEWLHNFQAFYDYIGPKPPPKYSIDRINNDGNYEPGNVRWSTISTQCINSRPDKPRKGLILTDEKVKQIRELLITHSRKELANKFSVSYATICDIVYGRSWVGRGLARSW